MRLVTENSLGVVYEKLRTVERELKELKKDQQRDRAKIDDRFNKVDERFEKFGEEMEELTNFNSKIEVMFSNLLESHGDLKNDIAEIGKKVDKESGMRGFIVDIVKLLALLVSFIATGKWLL